MHYSTKTTPTILWQAIIVLILIWSTACTTGPVTRSTYSPTANFRVFQTYAWHKAELPSPITGGGRGYSTLLDQQIKLAVESELVKNGMRPSEEAPDLLIAYDIALPATSAAETDTVFATGFGYGYSYWYGYRYRYNVSDIPAYRSVADLPPGTLIIDLIDPTNNRLVWRGWYEAGIDPVVAGDQDINKAVANVMSQYPPVPATVQ